jgi:glycine dehydrogenase
MDKALQQAAGSFSFAFIQENKFWPAVSRVNNTYGDRNLVCTCDPVESYMEAAPVS